MIFKAFKLEEYILKKLYNIFKKERIIDYDIPEVKEDIDFLYEKFIIDTSAAPMVS